MARADIAQIKKCLESFNLKTLFYEELGWNRLRDASFTLPHNGQSYTFEPLAEKGGFKIYTCIVQYEPFPEDKTLKQLYHLTELYARERLLIFLDDARTRQVWLWVKQEQGKPRAARINRLYQGQSANLLAHKLSTIFFGLDEEESADLVMAYGRIKSGFDVDKVTTKFYERFKKEHMSFLGHIRGITDDKDREWYASLTLNRLMFLYFIQKQGFLDNPSQQRLEGDRHYLRHRLQMTQEQRGENYFYTFYRYFLLCLFHDGLGQRMHTPELEQVIGKVPYLNGGLFDVHFLEHQYQDIQISDEAFESVFAFFDDFDWYLDDRPTRKGNEINPDVLGYIFEKYINQKQMGAYYTKEDITGYISKNTIIPFLFEMVMERCPMAFSPDGPVWSLLRENPDNYIYDAVAYGVHEPLPLEIEEGVINVALRTRWNKPAPETHALPTEIWREVVARRERYDEIHSRIITGQMTSINDLITYNLDISAFALDVIAACEDLDLLLAFYNTIEQVTVLDPTCGSGAFLFAALNILQPLYQACLERMCILVEEHNRLDVASPVIQRKANHPIDQFRQILTRVELHHSQRYFILKSIIINNLYGVDIMAEAVEICKLRLFLKLVAQVTKPDELEPLPDIDFNILTGNTLIGFTKLDEVRQIVKNDLIAGVTQANALARIEGQVKEIERTEQHFRSLQTESNVNTDSQALHECKQSLRTRLHNLRAELDCYLAPEYGIDRNNIANETAYKERYEQWQKSHQPFHWWIEFYEIMNSGGFDVIIGNPPYVEYNATKFLYRLHGFQTLVSANLYTCVVERNRQLLSRQGYHGMILPLAAFATKNMTPFIECFYRWFSQSWLSFYHFRPSMLFSGGKVASIPTTIFIANAMGPVQRFTTRLIKWPTDERSQLFSQLVYCHVTVARDKENRHYYPKLGYAIENVILEKILRHRRIETFLSKTSDHNTMFYRSAGGLYWKVFVDFPWPYETTSNKQCSFQEGYKRDVFVALFNSSVFWWYYTVTFDTFNLKDYMIFGFRFSYPEDTRLVDALCLCNQRLMEDFRLHAQHLKRGKTGSYTVYARKSKPIIDEIDRLLAQHYGFTEEELDFIINYDIKYRMGLNNEDEE
jgi:hypothetical protein